MTDEHEDPEVTYEESPESLELKLLQARIKSREVETKYFEAQVAMKVAENPPKVMEWLCWSLWPVAVTVVFGLFITQFRACDVAKAELERDSNVESWRAAEERARSNAALNLAVQECFKHTDSCITTNRCMELYNYKLEEK